ncbi:unnamed protein product, partial [Prorocentrum cordatum]
GIAISTQAVLAHCDSGNSRWIMSCFECFAGICGGGAYSKKKAALKKAKGLVVELVKSKSCAPILVRTAWHDSGTYDKANAGKPWPNAGGAIGSIITDHEILAAPNAGLQKAITSYLQPIKDACGDDISWADLIQLASATGIEVEGGPKIPMKYGRVDGVPTELQPPPFGHRCPQRRPHSRPSLRGPLGHGEGGLHGGDQVHHPRLPVHGELSDGRRPLLDEELDEV